ncbi:FlgO family outer membrane protein [Aliarcobacter skirrowii]|uniref:FlgO family outer membrane protein n=1 Tax=Aliarcobacter skirrowii TaxID=28200 RepID=UPI002A366312|nr:FlgO family outer membrane protein [Aliarcobacter skirrowii]MDY0180026.1 FlgO family outer membrane protein [Aliarcobacter skirrowii]
MSKKFLRFSILLAVISVFAGCSHKNQDTNSEYDRVKSMSDGMNIANFKQNKVVMQNTLEATIASLATQMVTNRKVDTNKSIIVTSFVQLDKFKQTSEFGRVIGESMIDELSNKGFSVTEFRGQLAVSVNDKGEYFLSRERKSLKSEIPSNYVVVGTYSRQLGKIILNARIIDNITGKVISSARATYNHNYANDCVIFGDCPPLRTIKIVDEKR